MIIRYLKNIFSCRIQPRSPCVCDIYVNSVIPPDSDVSSCHLPHLHFYMMRSCWCHLCDRPNNRIHLTSVGDLRTDRRKDFWRKKRLCLWNVRYSSFCSLFPAPFLQRTDETFCRVR